MHRQIRNSDCEVYFTDPRALEIHLLDFRHRWILYTNRYAYTLFTPSHATAPIE
jgi:hypothetical protein